MEKPIYFVKYSQKRCQTSKRSFCFKLIKREKKTTFILCSNKKFLTEIVYSELFGTVEITNVIQIHLILFDFIMILGEW